MMKRLAICILSLTLAVSMPFLASEGQTLIRANDQFNQSNLEGLKGYEYDAATDSWSYSAYHLWMLADSAVVFGLQLTGSGSTGVSVPPFLYLKHVDLTGKPLRFARSLNVEVSGRNYGFSDLKESDPLSILFLGETGRQLAEDLASAQEAAVHIGFDDWSFSEIIDPAGMKDLAEAAGTLTRLRFWDCFDPADLATYDSFYKASVEESAAPAEDVAPETSVGARPFAPPSDFEGRRQALYCFLDSAFGGGSDTDDRNFMIRWETDINVSVEGEYTQEDLSFLDSFLARLGREVPGLPPVTRRGDKAEAGINVAFAPLSRMGNYVRDYEEGSWGYYYFSYEDSRLTRVDIAIASDVTSQAQRNYLILYEMAGALGLIDPIHSYSDSILYDDWTEAQELSPLDFMILGYLYNSALDAGMTAPEAYAALYPGLSQ